MLVVPVEERGGRKGWSVGRRKMKAKRGKGGAAMEIACSWLTWLVKKAFLTPPWRSTFVGLSHQLFIALTPSPFIETEPHTGLGYRPEFLGLRGAP